MPIKISDKFYFPYSFSVDFGYSSKREVEFVEILLKKHAFPTTNYNVLTTLEFVRDLAEESRNVNDLEIQLIKKICKEEKITGGFIPPDIQICYQTLEIILQVFGVMGGIAVIDKFTGDRISKATARAITKLQKNNKARKLISKFKKKLKRRGKSTRKKTAKKSNRKTTKSLKKRKTSKKIKR